MQLISNNSHSSKNICVPINQNNQIIDVSFDNRNSAEDSVVINKISYESPWDSVHRYFSENNMINDSDKWIFKNSPRLPSLGEAQQLRLYSIMNTDYEVHFGSSDTPVKRTTTLKKCLESLQYKEIKIIGGSVQWILGKDFFHNFLSSLSIPKEILSEGLYEELQEFPPDIDIRIIIPESSNQPMKTWTTDLFKRLAILLNVTTQEIYNSCDKMYASKSEDRTQLSMATLKFYHHNPLEINLTPPSVAFKIDFVFAKFLPRKCFCRRDALTLTVQIPYTGACTLTSTLPEIREALAHTITRRLSIPDIKTVDKKGLPLLLSASAKGRFPSKIKQLKYLYNRAISNSSISLIGEDLRKTIMSHNNESEQAFLAATFNATVFLGEEARTKIISDTFCRKNENSSFLEIIDHAINEDLRNFSLIQSFILLHAHLGFEDGVAVFRKAKEHFIEIKCKEPNTKKSNSIFFPYVFNTSIEQVASSTPSKLLESMSSAWLLNTNLDGLPLPDNCLPYINRLFNSNSLAAQKLSLFLLLRWHLQSSTDENIETLLIYFSALILHLPEAERLHCENMLTTVIHKSRIFRHLETTIFESEIKKYSKNPETCLLSSLAKSLYQLDSYRFCHFALKLLLKANDSSTPKKDAFMILDPSSMHSLPLFFEYHTELLLDATCEFDVFLKLLKGTPSAQCYIHKIKNYIRSLSPEQKKEFNVNRIEEITNILKEIDWSLVNIFRKALGNKSEQKEEQNLFWEEQKLKEIATKIKSSNDTRNNTPDFLKLLNSTINKSFSGELKILFGLLFEKMMKNGGNDIDLALKFLVEKNVLLLFENDQDALLAHFNSLYASIQRPDNHLKGRMCETLGQLLAITDIANKTSETSVELFRFLLENLASMPPKKFRAYKDGLEKPLNRIIPYLQSTGDYSTLYKFLMLAELLGLALTLDSDIALNIIIEIEKDSTNAKDDLIRRMEDAYKALKRINQELSSYRAKNITLAFLEAHIRLQSYTKGVFWAKQLTEPDPLIESLSLGLIDNKLWMDFQDLLTHDHGKLFEPLNRYNKLTTLIKAIITDNPLETAKLYRCNLFLFQDYAPKEELEMTVNEIAKSLTYSNSHAGAEAALNLIIDFKTAPNSTWLEIIRRLPKSTNNKHLMSIWSMLESKEEAPIIDCVRALIMVHFPSDKMKDPSLLKYIFRENNEHFLGLFKNKHERKNVCKKILDLYLPNNNLEKTPRNVISIESDFAIKKIPSEDPALKSPSNKFTFKDLDVFRAEHIPEMAQSELIEKWLHEADVSNIIDCFTYFEKQELFQHFTSIKAFRTVFDAMQKVIKEEIIHIEPKIYENILKTMNQKKFQQLVTQEIFADFFVVAVPKIISKARETQDRILIQTLILCYITHEEYAFSIFNENGMLCRYEISKNIDLLLLSMPGEAVFPDKEIQIIFNKFNRSKLIGSKIMNKNKDKKEHLIRTTHNSFLSCINTLLNSNTHNISCLIIILSNVNSFFDNFFADYSSWKIEQQKEALEVFEHFIYSHLFYNRNGSEEAKLLEQEHRRVSLSLLVKAQIANFFMAHAGKLPSFLLFLNDEKNCKDIPDNMKTDAVKSSIVMFRENKLPYNQERVIDLMCKYSQYLKNEPAFVDELLRGIFQELFEKSKETNTLKINIPLEILKKIPVFFTYVFLKSNYKENEIKYFNQWEILGPKLLFLYGTTLQNIFSMNEKNQRDLFICVSMCTFLLKNFTRNQENKTFFVQFFILFVSMATLILNKYPDDMHIKSFILKTFKSPPLPVNLKLSILYLEDRLFLSNVTKDIEVNLFLFEAITSLHKQSFFNDRRDYDKHTNLYKILKKISKETTEVFPQLTPELITEKLQPYSAWLDKIASENISPNHDFGAFGNDSSDNQ